MQISNSSSQLNTISSSSSSNHSIHPHFVPSNNNLSEKFLSDSNETNSNNDKKIITDEEGVQRYLSTSKMSSRGPVSQEFTVKGSTPSGKPRLFVCSICTRAFARQEHLKRHERSHTKEKPFTCNICSRKFSRRDLLLRHSTKLHAGAADVIPRLRKKSLKHMKKDELSKINIGNNINKSNSMSISTATNSTSLNRNSIISLNDNESISTNTSIIPNLKLNKNKLKTQISNQDNENGNGNGNDKAKSNMISKVLNKLNSNLDNDSKFNKTITNSQLHNINLFNDLNTNDNMNSNFDLENEILNSNNNNILNNSLILNESEIQNQIQLPLYPLNDNNLDPMSEFSDLSSTILDNSQSNSTSNNNINNNNNNNHNNNYDPIQSNAYNYYRRASFSAMSGVNYALTNPEPYATETVEFSTPQFNSIDDAQEKWLNSLSDNSPVNQLKDFNNNNNKENGLIFETEIQQLSNLINKTHEKQQQEEEQEQQHNINNINELNEHIPEYTYNNNNNNNDGNNINSNQNMQRSQSYSTNKTNSTKSKMKGILNSGYSFYNDDVTIGITESLFKTRLVDPKNSNQKKLNTPLPFKSTSPIMQSQVLNLLNKSKYNSNDKLSNKMNNLNLNKKDIKINVLDRLNLDNLEKLSSYSSSSNGNHDTSYNNTNTNTNTNNQGTKNKNTINNINNNIENNDKSDALNKVLSWQQNLFNQPISNLEEINEMNISNTYGIPQGYSFYDVDDINSKSIKKDKNNCNHYHHHHNHHLNKSNNNGLFDDTTLSSEATISPVLLEPTSSNYDEMDIDDNLNNNSNYFNKINYEKYKNIPFEEDFNETKFQSYSQVYLFTNNIRKLIKYSLIEYPFFGTPTPELLSNDILNYYVDQFISKFLTHHPFIHKSILNEFYLIKDSLDNILNNSVSIEESKTYTGEKIKYIRDENFNENFKVSIICLPLLITTIGSVVSNKKDDASNLYEISRRCIHVYLESRKRLRTCGGLNNNGINEINENNENSINSPLWLIQSLTLSIIYGLFADEEISLSVIIRQVHALNALIKSSDINELKDLKMIKTNFVKFIKYESTIRTYHMIFHVSTLLSTLYNILPSLTINDMDIDLPNATLLWECYNEEEYLKLIENFDFDSFNFREVLNDLILIDLNIIDLNTGLINGSNFLLNHHVSEFGLNCLQNGLHQLVYFKNSELENIKESNDSNNLNNDDNIMDNNNGNNNKFLTIEGFEEVSIEQIRKIGEIWNLIVNSCVLYNESSEVFNDCKILNHYLNLKLSSIVSLNKIKESVWLKSFNEINEQYISTFNYTDDELKDSKFQNELIDLIENSIDILKLVFFNNDNSLMGKISPSFKLNNKTIEKLDSMYLTPPPQMETEYELNRINLNILHKLSIDSQILFDVILIIVKFLFNYENFFKMRMKFNNLTNLTFLKHFDLSSTINNNNTNNINETLSNPEEAINKFDKILFKYYLKFFKIFLNLEQFLKHNYNYEDFETGEALKSLNNINLPDLSNDDDNINEIDKLINESHKKYKETENSLNDIVSDDLVVLHDRDLIMNELINFRLPYKFLKMGGFLFGFIYDKNFKFINFKHLSDVLFHLRIFLESKDEYV